MSLDYAILGLLSWQPFSGYDLKKIFEESPTYYWSGNNNQIYRTLLDLYRDGLVTQEVIPQENLPARKVYRSTPQGEALLHQWVLTTPELPHRKHAFLLQLGWADSLTPAELDTLLAQYQEEMQALAVIARVRSTDSPYHPSRTTREALLWQAIGTNWVMFYENEVSWARDLRTQLQSLETATTGT